MNILNGILALIFVAFAWLQRNDIDPEIYHNASSLDSALWLLFYLLIAAGFIWLCFRKIPRFFFILAITACLIEMALSGPGLWENLFGDQPFTMTQVSMSADDARVELTREFFGALIALAAIVFQLWQNNRSEASEK